MRSRGKPHAVRGVSSDRLLAGPANTLVPGNSSSAEAIKRGKQLLNEDHDRTSDGVRVGEVADSCASETGDESCRISSVALQRLDRSRRYGASQRIAGKIREALRHGIGGGGLQQAESIQAVLGLVAPGVRSCGSAASNATIW